MHSACRRPEFDQCLDLSRSQTVTHHLKPSQQHPKTVRVSTLLSILASLLHSHSRSRTLVVISITSFTHIVTNHSRTLAAYRFSCHQHPPRPLPASLFRRHHRGLVTSHHVDPILSHPSHLPSLTPIHFAASQHSAAVSQLCLETRVGKVCRRFRPRCRARTGPNIPGTR